MQGLRQVCLATALVAVGPALASAQEMEAEVIHWWTSGGESAAVQVFADAFTEAGGTWIDNAVAGGVNARTAGINWIVGGDPPTAMQFNTGLQFDEIVSNGFLRDLEDVAEAGKWREVLPEAIIQATNRDGKFYAVPVNIHGQNWLWYNTQVFADAGVEPPTDYAEMLEIGPKLRAAGVVPLAFAGEPNWEAFVFDSVLVTEGGRDLYLEVPATRTSTRCGARASAASPRLSPGSGTSSTRAAPAASGTTPPIW